MVKIAKHNQHTLAHEICPNTLPRLEFHHHWLHYQILPLSWWEQVIHASYTFSHTFPAKIRMKYFQIISSTKYTQSSPVRNGDKSQWVRFLYFPDFWLVFVNIFKYNELVSTTSKDLNFFLPSSFSWALRQNLNKNINFIHVQISC